MWGKYHKEYRENGEVDWWHQAFSSKSQELKLKYDWFVIVRNPYERLISEFYCKLGGLGNKKTLDHIDEEKFNNYIKNKIMKIGLPGQNNHYTEQYKYIDPNTTIHILKYENLEFEFNELMKKYKLDIVLHQKDNESVKKKKI